MKITLIVGETSGDNLGAGLIQALRARFPEAEFDGIPGPKMKAVGCQEIEPMEKIAVMGFLEPLKRLPTILNVRRHLIQHCLHNPPDLFIGIDAPDFNLSIERKLKEAGIKTVHYVSPSVWGWRQGRIHKIKKSVDLMLTLFPFETKIYEEHHIPVKFVGHPLAEIIPMNIDLNKAKEKVGLDPNKKVLTVLPGSRNHEIHQLTEPFIKTILWCKEKLPELQIITSMVNHARRTQFEKILKEISPDLEITILDGQSHDAIAAADALLLASGTVTLEGMLYQKPMVVAYKMWRLTYGLLRLLVKAKHFALPNLIADDDLVPELLQKEVCPEVMGPLLLDYLTDTTKSNAIIERFKSMHEQLKCDANETAAEAIEALLSFE